MREACNERVRLRVCSCVCWCPCARAVRACVYACLCERMCGSVRFHRIAIPRVCAPRRCARPPIARRRLAVFIARPAPRVAAARCGCVRCDRPVVARVLGAGVTWTCRTASAPWAAREWHTSVIDAAGAIYVIGGATGTYTYLQDVWASTDGGARAGLGQGGGLGGTRVGYSSGVLRGTAEY
jgi:hypothetical protein